MIDLVEVTRFPTNNGAGWVLDVKRYWEPHRLDRSLRPILIIPGYCMNTFVLAFHPEGLSMVEYLARHGFEVWTANLRCQGDSRRVGGDREAGFSELALEDLPCVISAVRESTECARDEVDLIGCSLGGTFIYAYLAHHPSHHHIGSIVAVGAPLRWDRIHPLLKTLFGSPRLAGAVPIRGTRRLARTALPIVKRFPRLLSIYMNAKIIDLSAADELVKTVDDPIRRLNREISEWVRAGDLTVEGINVSEAMHRIDRPLLCVVANKDGIVPPEAARSIAHAIGSKEIEMLEVGTPEIWFAHADLFVSRHAQSWVFEPLARWLEAQAKKSDAVVQSAAG